MIPTEPDYTGTNTVRESSDVIYRVSRTAHHPGYQPVEAEGRVVDLSAEIDRVASDT